MIGAMAAETDSKEAAPSVKYPSARRDETCSTTHFGIRVFDPYRWLDDPFDEETKEFVEAQNNLSRPFFRTPLRQQFLQTLTAAYNFPKQGVPERYGNIWVSWYNAGLQHQRVLHVRKSSNLDEKPWVLLDPNTWTADGTSSVDITEFTDDASLMAYSRTDKGSDWKKIHFMKVEDGSTLGDVLTRVKFSGICWAPDNSGIFYSRYDGSTGEPEAESGWAKLRFQKVYFHKLGTEQKDDILVMEHPDEPDWISHMEITWDNRFLIASVFKDCTPANQVWIADLEEAKLASAGREGKLPAYDISTLKWRNVASDFSSSYEYITNNGHLFYFLTNKEAPRYQILTFNLREEEPAAAWRIHIPETRHLLEKAVSVGSSNFVLQYLVDVAAALHIYDISSGKFTGEVTLPFPGSITAVSGRRKFSHFFFKFESFTTPPVIYSVSLPAPPPTATPATEGTAAQPPEAAAKAESHGKELKPEAVYKTEVKGLDPTRLTVRRIFYTGKDGVNIPIFIVHKKDACLSPETPTLLYAYGGFNATVKPTFRVGVAVMSLHGGITYVTAHIRGGGEYGKEWYEAAIKTKKQVSLDDFQQAAEFLIESGYTSPNKLAIRGASNGGFLVAACVNQRPDLYKAAVIEVGVLDLTRFDKFTIGSAWKSDFGDPGIEEEFNAIFKISPLQNIGKSAVAAPYPALLVTTADHDDRVAPCHSLKYIAEVQHVLGKDPSQKNPFLLRVETKTGHGAGKATSQILQEEADVFGFLAKVFHLQWQA